MFTVTTMNKTYVNTAICYMHKKYGIAWTLFERED